MQKLVYDSVRPRFHEQLLIQLISKYIPCSPDYKTRILDAGKSACVYVPWGLDAASKFGEEKIIHGTPASYRCKFF